LLAHRRRATLRRVFATMPGTKEKGMSATPQRLSAGPAQAGAAAIPRRAAPVEVAHRMDRLPVTRLHVLATALCAFGFSFDLMEMALGNMLSAVFSLPPASASRQELAWLLASVYLGAIAGAPLLGHWADLHGRRIVLIGALGWLALTSWLGALSSGVLQLSLTRAMAGLALGAYPPLMFAYLTDVLPPARRGLLTFLTVAFGAFGPPAGIFLVRALSPDGLWGIEAWRWAFIVGGAGAGGVALLFRLLPESPRWLEASGRQAEADAMAARFEASPTVLTAAPPHAPDAASAAAADGAAGTGAKDAKKRALASVSLLYLLAPWSTVAFPVLVGAVLVNKGFRMQDALLFVGVSMFGLVIGSALSAAFVDRIQRRTALAGCGLAMVLCGTVFALSTQPAWLIAAATLFVFFSALYVPTLTMYGSEVFPTASRARYSAIAWAFNRVGAAAAPFVLLPLLHGAGPLAMSAVVSGTLLAGIAVLWLCPRGFAGRAVH